MDAIVLSAGKGSRTKLNYPKQLMRLGGKPILIHILEILNSVEEIDKIIVAVPEKVDYYINIINNYNINNFICILGGKTRQESVFLSLQYVDSDRVLIHEAARPFINKDFIKKILSIEHDAVVPYVLPSQTIFYNGTYLDRNMVYNIQLPQIFNTQALKIAHHMALNKNYTDDSSLLYSELGILPYFVEGLEENIKITTPLDVKISEVIYEEVSNSGWW